MNNNNNTLTTKKGVQKWVFGIFSSVYIAFTREGCGKIKEITKWNK